MRSNLLISTLLLITACSTAQVADQAYINGKIYTADKNQSFAQAIAIKEGTIIYVGSDEGIEDFLNDATEVLDLEGNLMLPGIHDVHIHTLEASSDAWGQCALDSEEPDPENQAFILEECQLQPNANGWLTATGYSFLNMLEAERPVKLKKYSMNYILTNPLSYWKKPPIPCGLTLWH